MLSYDIVGIIQENPYEYLLSISLIPPPWLRFLFFPAPPLDSHWDRWLGVLRHYFFGLSPLPLTSTVLYGSQLEIICASCSPTNLPR